MFTNYSFNRNFLFFFNIYFFQIHSIVIRNTPGLPIPAPKWLIFFSLFMECAAIDRRFQTQPRTRMEWLMLEWSQRTIELLPPTMRETDWDLSLPVPPPFDINAEVMHDGYFEVKYIFKI